MALGLLPESEVLALEVGPLDRSAEGAGVTVDN